MSRDVGKLLVSTGGGDLSKRVAERRLKEFRCLTRWRNEPRDLAVDVVLASLILEVEFK